VKGTHGVTSSELHRKVNVGHSGHVLVHHLHGLNIIVVNIVHVMIVVSHE
jgi:hypothetical protein